MKQRRNGRVAETGDTRENPPTSGFVRHGGWMGLVELVGGQGDTLVREKAARLKYLRAGDDLREISSPSYQLLPDCRIVSHRFGDWNGCECGELRNYNSEPEWNVQTVIAMCEEVQKMWVQQTSGHSWIITTGYRQTPPPVHNGNQSQCSTSIHTRGGARRVDWAARKFSEVVGDCQGARSAAKPGTATSYLGATVSSQSNRAYVDNPARFRRFSTPRVAPTEGEVDDQNILATIIQEIRYPRTGATRVPIGSSRHARQPFLVNRRALLESPEMPFDTPLLAHSSRRERVELISVKEATEFTCSEYWYMAMAMGASGGQAPCMLHASNMRKGALLWAEQTSNTCRVEIAIPRHSLLCSRDLLRADPGLLKASRDHGDRRRARGEARSETDRERYYLTPERTVSCLTWELQTAGVPALLGARPSASADCHRNATLSLTKRVARVIVWDKVRLCMRTECTFRHYVLFPQRPHRRAPRGRLDVSAHCSPLEPFSLYCKSVLDGVGLGRLSQKLGSIPADHCKGRSFHRATGCYHSSGNCRAHVAFWQERAAQLVDWRRAVFSDVSRFCLDADDHRIRVWRRPGRLHDPRFIIERRTAPTRDVLEIMRKFSLRLPDAARPPHFPEGHSSGLTQHGYLWPACVMSTFFFDQQDPQTSGPPRTFRTRLGGNFSQRQLWRIWRVSCASCGMIDLPQVNIRRLYAFVLNRIATCLHATRRKPVWNLPRKIGRIDLPNLKQNLAVQGEAGNAMTGATLARITAAMMDLAQAFTESAPSIVNSRTSEEPVSVNRCTMARCLRYSTEVQHLRRAGSMAPRWISRLADRSIADRSLPFRPQPWQHLRAHVLPLAHANCLAPVVIASNYYRSRLRALLHRQCVQVFDNTSITATMHRLDNNSRYSLLEVSPQPSNVTSQKSPNLSIICMGQRNILEVELHQGFRKFGISRDWTTPVYLAAAFLMRIIPDWRTQTKRLLNLPDGKRLVTEEPERVAFCCLRVRFIDSSLAAPVCAVSVLASHQGDPGSMPGRITRDFRMWESCRTMPLVGGFYRGLSTLISITFIVSEDDLRGPCLGPSWTVGGRRKRLYQVSTIFDVLTRARTPLCGTAQVSIMLPTASC
ncbi:hypothetical protein PR048_025207 [Dryococelus australis]|uniref:Uncharacterized protein n=1 Tax=Dryococelus australis TaxID=614101 RepID=A0ABQ9GQS9_9NEOP|nr:hypothetical protein PR048_025207 [Dryococelus australis]